MLSLASVAFPAIPAGLSIVPLVLSVIAKYSGLAVTMLQIKKIVAAGPFVSNDAFRV